MNYQKTEGFEWVDRYIETITKLEGRTKKPLVKFRFGRGSGYAHFKWTKRKFIGQKRKLYFSHITINYNGVDKSAKMVLLHELAHAFMRPKAGHNLKFWIKAWGYYEHFKDELDWELVKKSEFRYKGKSKVVYDRLYPEVELPLGQLHLAI